MDENTRNLKLKINKIMRRQYQIVVVYTHYVIVQKTKLMDLVCYQPNPFYFSFQKAVEMRQKLIENGVLSEKKSSVEGAYFITLCMN